MMEVKAPLPLDCQVHIDQVVGPRGQANEPGNEKHKALYACQVWVTVGYYSSDYQTCPQKYQYQRGQHHLPILLNFWMFPPKLGWCGSFIVPGVVLDQGYGVLGGGVNIILGF